MELLVNIETMFNDIRSKLLFMGNSFNFLTN